MKEKIITMIQLCKIDIYASLCETRIKITFFLSALFIYIALEEGRSFAISVDRNISTWIFPFLVCTRLVRILFWGCFLFMVSELPYTANNQVFVIVRASKKIYLMSKIGYLIIVSFSYSCFIFICSIVECIPHLEFTLNWGKVIGTLVLTDASSSFQNSIVYNSMFVNSLKPVYTTGITFFLMMCSFLVLGMIIYLCNLVSHSRLAGIMIAGFFILLDFLLETDILQRRLFYVSPISWSNLMYLNIDGTDSYTPTLQYVICGYILIIFLLVAGVCIYSKHYSIEKMEEVHEAGIY